MRILIARAHMRASSNGAYTRNIPGGWIPSTELLFFDLTERGMLVLKI